MHSKYYEGSQSFVFGEENIQGYFRGKNFPNFKNDNKAGILLAFDPINDMAFNQDTTMYSEETFNHYMKIIHYMLRKDQTLILGLSHSPLEADIAKQIIEWNKKVLFFVAGGGINFAKLIQDPIIQKGLDNGNLTLVGTQITNKETKKPQGANIELRQKWLLNQATAISHFLTPESKTDKLLREYGNEAKKHYCHLNVIHQQYQKINEYHDRKIEHLFDANWHNKFTSNLDFERQRLEKSNNNEIISSEVSLLDKMKNFAAITPWVVLPETAAQEKLKIPFTPFNLYPADKKKTIVWIDTETTGLDAEKNDVIQIGMIISQGEDILYHNKWNIRPTQKGIWTKEAENVHGITKKEAMAFPKGEDIIPEILQKINLYAPDGYLMAGHNFIAYDNRMLNKCFEKHGFSINLDSVGMFDTKIDINKNFPELPSKLQTLIKEFDMPLVHAHDAMDDIANSMRLWVFLRTFEVCQGIKHDNILPEIQDNPIQEYLQENDITYNCYPE